MTVSRRLVDKYTPEGEPGFLGNGHIARRVIQKDFADSDPFILLMDDMLDKKDNTPAGGPHPHAGFETGTLILEGDLGVGEDRMTTGDFQLMTAGSGIVHTETIDKPARIRILQLWLSLPKEDRWAPPRLQDLPLAHVPTLHENGVDLKLYSGSLAGLTSPLQNYSPFILADIYLQPGTTTVQQLPADYHTFLYVLRGSVTVGPDAQLLEQDQVGWLDTHAGDALTDLQLNAGKTGVRFVLYAGQPTGNPIKPYGPFIGNDSQDIIRLYEEYNEGKMKHVTALPEAQKMVV